MLKKFCIFICIFALFMDGVYGGIELSGGWDIVGDGQGTSCGQTELSSCSSDPSVTMGITSTSAIYGQGNFKDHKSGSQSVNLPIGGYTLSVSYNGSVDSSLDLNSGSASTTAFIGATAAGISTGQDGFDLFGSADISTDGYLNGLGTATALADGSASYSAARMGTPSEAWGEASGSSQLSMICSSASSMASTGGVKNGLHVDSKASRDIMGVTQSSSRSQVISYASVVNPGRVNASSSGTAQGGAWSPSFSGQKSRLTNEDVASSAKGMLTGYVESNGQMDAADVSSILQSTASRIRDDLSVSGGPATYSAVTQSSSAVRTWAEAWVKKSTWGSVARSGLEVAVQWGNLDAVGSGSQSYQRNASALSFGKILMKTDLLHGQQTSSTGNMSLQTFAQARNDTRSVAGTVIGPTGNGSMMSDDGYMTNTAGFVGNQSDNLFHYSLVNATAHYAETHNILGSGFVNTEPFGNVSALRPFNLSTVTDPNIAWSNTDGFFSQAH